MNIIQSDYLNIRLNEINRREREQQAEDKRRERRIREAHTTAHGNHR